MVEDIKNILLAGVGTAAYSYEKALNFVENMVEKGKLTVEQGKELNEEIKNTLKDKEKKCVETRETSISKDDMRDLLKEMNFATKSDLDALSERIKKLEEKKL